MLKTIKNKILLVIIMSDKIVELSTKLISSINTAPLIVITGAAIAGLIMYKNTPVTNNNSVSDVPDK